MLLFLLAVTRLFLVDAPEKTILSVDVQNIKIAKGVIYVGIYRPCDGFPIDCKPLERRQITARDGSVQTQFSVEPGDYAIAIYHDVNDNGRMDKNIVGIPKEPYGFSNNFRPRLSPPKFSDCKIGVSTAGKAVSIRVE